MNAESRTYRRTPETIAEARAFVAEFFDPGSDVSFDASLLISELAGNAIRHATGGSYKVTVESSADGTRVLVEDFGGTASIPRPREASETREGGRGLALVEAYAASWGTAATVSGRVVWFEIATSRAALSA
jgi:anti-sigma regulatory factor (Ser/Thr protein kinase)